MSGYTAPPTRIPSDTYSKPTVQRPAISRGASKCSADETVTLVHPLGAAKEAADRVLAQQAPHMEDGSEATAAGPRKPEPVQDRPAASQFAVEEGQVRGLQSIPVLHGRG